MNNRTSDNRSNGVSTLFQNVPINRGMAFGVIIITALLAFEIFNYSTTDFALSDLLGDLRFAGLRRATILAIAFCGIDFAGIARLFTPAGSQNNQNETWYLFGAWLLAATMNAMLTWWGVSLAVLNHDTLGNAVVDRATLLRAVPIFVALLVWLIRVLIIGTFSAAGDRLFNLAETEVSRQPSRQVARPQPRAAQRPVSPAPAPAAARSLNQRPAPMRTENSRSTPSQRAVQRPASLSRPLNAPQSRTFQRNPPPPEPELPEPPYVPLEPIYQPLFSPAEYADAELVDPPVAIPKPAQRRF